MKALLFDMDGVLVDVSRSYREAVRRTVLHFSGRLPAPEVIQGYKNRGGFNNDWDLTHWLLCDMGHDIERKEVVAFFQGVYRGADFDGTIRRETWLLSTAVLENLAARFKTGVVTGRPADEAEYALDRFGMGGRFGTVVTADSVPSGRGKPDPFGLKAALAVLGADSGFYCGDTVDDMKAAVGAGLVPIGVIAPGSDPETQSRVMREEGAVHVLADINSVGEVLR